MGGTNQNRYETTKCKIGLEDDVPWAVETSPKIKKKLSRNDFDWYTHKLLHNYHETSQESLYEPQIRITFMFQHNFSLTQKLN